MEVVDHEASLWRRGQLLVVFVVSSWFFLPLSCCHAGMESAGRESNVVDHRNTNVDLDSRMKRADSYGKNHWEERLVALGLVDVQIIDETLLVDLKYACDRNFMGANVYGDLKKCYLQKEAASKLKRANENLKRRHPDFSLLVADGFRPRSVQRRMWEMVKNTPMQRYVANPDAGSIHNYGAAVDLTIVDGNGVPLDMGTPMDHFGVLSQPKEELRFLKEGKLTAAQVANRRLLREVMTEAGFESLNIEWWHFNAFDRKTVKKRYRMLD